VTCNDGRRGFSGASELEECHRYRSERPRRRLGRRERRSASDFGGGHVLSPHPGAAQGGPHASEIRVIETRSRRPAAAETAAVFAHTSLDAHRIALEALTRGDALARRLPRSYGPLRDQLSRALQSAYLQTAEGAAKSLLFFSSALTHSTLPSRTSRVLAMHAFAS